MNKFTSQPLTKRCSLLQRRPDISTAEFRSHWAGPHAAIATGMPGIANYTQNRVESILLTWSNIGFQYKADGIVELEFHDSNALEAANQTIEVQQLLPEDEPRFLRGITLCQVPSGARQIWPNRTKLMLAARLESDTTEAWQQLANIVEHSGCVTWSSERVHDTRHRPSLYYEALPPHFFATLWFDGPVNLQNLVAVGRFFERGTLWRVDPLQVVG
jgi:hypothetical protein